MSEELDWKNLVREIYDLKKQLSLQKKVIAGLKKYSRHFADCKLLVLNSMSPCSCGFTEDLKKYEEME